MIGSLLTILQISCIELGRITICLSVKVTIMLIQNYDDVIFTFSYELSSTSLFPSMALCWFRSTLKIVVAVRLKVGTPPSLATVTLYWIAPSPSSFHHFYQSLDAIKYVCHQIKLKQAQGLGGLLTGV